MPAPPCSPAALAAPAAAFAAPAPAGGLAAAAGLLFEPLPPARAAVVDAAAGRGGGAATALAAGCMGPAALALPAAESATADAGRGSEQVEVGGFLPCACHLPCLTDPAALAGTSWGAAGAEEGRAAAEEGAGAAPSVEARLAPLSCCMSVSADACSEACCLLEAGAVDGFEIGGCGAELGCATRSKASDMARSPVRKEDMEAVADAAGLLPPLGGVCCGLAVDWSRFAAAAAAAAAEPGRAAAESGGWARREGAPDSLRLPWDEGPSGAAAA